MSMPAPDQPHGADPWLESKSKGQYPLTGSVFAAAEQLKFPNNLLTVVSADNAMFAFDICRLAAETFLHADNRYKSRPALGPSSRHHQHAAIRILPASPRFPRPHTIFDCVVLSANEADERAVARANQVLESLHLFSVRDIPAAALPSAVQARVALAQMLVARPRILIAEPAAAHLPPRQQMQQFHLLRAAAIEGELIVLYPTSDARITEAASSVFAVSGERPRA